MLNINTEKLYYGLIFVRCASYILCIPIYVCMYFHIFQYYKPSAWQFLLTRQLSMMLLGRKKSILFYQESVLDIHAKQEINL